MGFATADMDFVKTAAAKKINWADLADSDDERTGGASSSSSPSSRANDVDRLRTVCSESLEALEVNDDCSTVAPSDCAESPRGGFRNRCGDAISEDEVVLDTRVQRTWQGCQGSMHETTPERWYDRQSEASWDNKWWSHDRWTSGNQWNDRWESTKSRGHWARQHHHGHGEDNSSWQSVQKQRMSAYERTGRWTTDTKEGVKKLPRKAAAHKRVTAYRKPQCQFIIGIEEDAEFGVKTKLLGPHGKHVKAIAEKTGAKMRLRGRGSGFKEGPEEQESEDPLMLCISAFDVESYEATKSLVRELLEGVYEQYYQHCTYASYRRPPRLRIQLHEGPREGSA